MPTKQTHLPGAALQSFAPRRPPLRVLILYACGQLGWSLAGYAVGNLLIYFYMPPETGAPMFPSFIFQGAVLGLFTLIGIMSAGGRFFDAVIDPLIANWSDRKHARVGKRRWFLLVGAVPLALTGLLSFYPPVAGESTANLLWLAGCIGAYYFFFAFYVIPYTALIAELGHDPQDRMRISTLLSVAWALGFLLGNSAYALQGWLEQRGHAPVEAFQQAMLLLHGLALAFLLLPALFLNENRYTHQRRPEAGLRESLHVVFGNRNYRRFLASNLLYWLSLTFIQLGIAFYTTLLLGLDKAYAFQFSLVSFVCSFLFYWPVNVLARRFGKKRLLMVAFGMFATIFAVVAFFPFPAALRVLMLYALGVAAAFPLAVFGILPNAVVGDEVEKEERASGRQLAGMFFGVGALVMKVGVSLANLLFPSFLLLGKSSGNALGVQLTAVAAIVFCLAGWWLLRKYEA